MTPAVRDDIPVIGDGELLPRLRGGDADAFALLMRQNNQRLYRLARGILRDEDEAEEAVQEGYVRALTHLDGFRGEANLSTWLARIVANEAFGRLRRRRPTAALGGTADSPAREAPDLARASPEHMAARREIRRLIERAIDALPAAFRTVFVLRAVEQLSVKETAAYLGIPEETVKTRLHRANRRLRQSLSEEFATIWDDAFPFAGSRCDGLVIRVLTRLRGGAAAPPGPGSA
jgi:RNA polymerase sigma-70 factor (ECF subfamily)